MPKLAARFRLGQHNHCRARLAYGSNILGKVRRADWIDSHHGVRIR